MSLSLLLSLTMAVLAVLSHLSMRTEVGSLEQRVTTAQHNISALFNDEVFQLTPQQHKQSLARHNMQTQSAVGSGCAVSCRFQSVPGYGIHVNVDTHDRVR
jgi:hypothetical protein